MIHKHHIIPKHAGGTDDPSNLVELTIEDHAIAHKVLHGLWKREEDHIAWLALSGQISTQEAWYLARMSPTAKRKLSESLKGKSYPKKVEFGQIVSEILKKYYKENPLPKGFGDGSAWIGRKHKSETKQSQSLRLKGRTWSLDPISGKRVWSQ